eukprot:TRINITY_DN13784_c0_g1_i1.p1 TRINITY_DN13784_c0_g1~~TRINITY_DN13784_c0_g1_i1.p1  ORF type:complete len:184 (-),score=45.40 TRINITY_DN13784_c0_g1_i1:42-593(-)
MTEAAFETLQAVRKDVGELDAALGEFRVHVSKVMEEHCGRIRSLMKARLHQEIEERCLAAQQRLDNIEPSELPEDCRGVVRAERKRLLSKLDSIASSVERETSQLQRGAGMICLEHRPASAGDDGNRREAVALGEDGEYVAWKDPQVVRRVFEHSLAISLRNGDEGSAMVLRRLLLEVEASLR